MAVGIESAVRRTLWRMLFWRMLGELFALPQYVVRAITLALSALASWFRQIELAIFTMELDAARRYALLTGIDMGTASGDASRYAALDPSRNAEIQQVGYNQWRQMNGLQEEEDA